ncbi:MAG: acetate kinase [Fibrobacterales bacterium]
MYILVLNCGSSSVKFSLFEKESKQVIMSGLAEKLISETPEIGWKLEQTGEKFSETLPNKEGAAFEKIVAVLEANNIDAKDIYGVGHRVVHGGEKFFASAQITEANFSELEKISDLAPLHNPANLDGIKFSQKVFPGVPQVAVFDTAFHQTIPQKAFMYAIPKELYEDHGIRKYGFHGTSHKFVSINAIKELGLDPENSGVIVAHMGNGCSATAIKNGKSVDTTMGLTPLAGLVMGTRSGDIDPSIHQFIQKTKGWDLDKITNVLNKKSGLLGLSGIDSDMRTITSEREKGNKAAELTLDIYCYNLAKHIFALSASLDRLDALVFTGGIGENSRVVRELTIAQLKILGFQLDSEKNETTGYGGSTDTGIITKEGSTIAYVLPTNEELMITMDTIEVIENS